MEKEKDKNSEKSMMFIPAGLLSGLGIGLLTFTINPGSVPGFLLLGLGVGMACSVIFSKRIK